MLIFRENNITTYVFFRKWCRHTVHSSLSIAITLKNNNHRCSRVMKRHKLITPNLRDITTYLYLLLVLIIMGTKHPSSRYYLIARQPAAYTGILLKHKYQYWLAYSMSSLVIYAQCLYICELGWRISICGNLSKRQMFTRCRLNVGRTYVTLAQH